MVDMPLVTDAVDPPEAKRPSGGGRNGSHGGFVVGRPTVPPVRVKKKRR